VYVIIDLQLCSCMYVLCSTLCNYYWIPFFILYLLNVYFINIPFMFVLLFCMSSVLCILCVCAVFILFCVLFCVLYCVLFCVFFFVLFCVLFPLQYIAVSFLFLYKSTDHCHRVQTQLRYISIILSYHVLHFHLVMFRLLLWIIWCGKIS